MSRTFKNLFINTYSEQIEINLLPDQIPVFFDGHSYQMNDEGDFNIRNNTSGELLKDSCDNPINYATPAILSFDKNKKIVDGPSEETLRNNQNSDEEVK